LNEGERRRKWTRKLEESFWKEDLKGLYILKLDREKRGKEFIFQEV